MYTVYTVYTVWLKTHCICTHYVQTLYTVYTKWMYTLYVDTLYMQTLWNVGTEVCDESLWCVCVVQWRACVKASVRVSWTLAFGLGPVLITHVETPPQAGTPCPG